MNEVSHVVRSVFVVVIFGARSGFRFPGLCILLYHSILKLVSSSFICNIIHILFLFSENNIFLEFIFQMP